MGRGVWRRTYRVPFPPRLVYEEVTEERPFAIFRDLAAMVDGYRRCPALEGSPDRLVPGHDPRVIRQYPVPSPDLEGMVPDIGPYHRTPPDRVPGWSGEPRGGRGSVAGTGIFTVGGVGR